MNHPPADPGHVRWIARSVVLAIHGEQLAEHGGGDGVRDSGLLDSALARPQQRLAYGGEGDSPGPDIPELAAVCAYGLIGNHPFVDGNKRVGAVVLELLLDLNGYDLPIRDGELVVAIEGIAGGGMDEDEFIAWVREKAIAR